MRGRRGQSTRRRNAWNSSYGNHEATPALLNRVTPWAIGSNPDVLRARWQANSSLVDTDFVGEVETRFTFTIDRVHDEVR